MDEKQLTPLYRGDGTNFSIGIDSVLTTLSDKSLTLYQLRQRTRCGEKELQELLLALRETGKVKFNIKSGKWSAARAAPIENGQS